LSLPNRLLIAISQPLAALKNGSVSGAAMI